MRKLDLFKYNIVLFLVIFFLAFFTSACNKNIGDKENKIDQQSDFVSVNKPVSIQLTIEPRLTKDIKGDFTKSISYSIQERAWFKLLDGELTCHVMDNKKLKCKSTDSLMNLTEGRVYRILIFNQHVGVDNKKENDEIGCDYFIYNKAQLPNLAITEKTSGECLIWQLSHDTGLSEEEIRRRVRHIVNNNYENSFDLSLEVYRLYKNYDTEHNWQNALYALAKLIKENKPLPPSSKSQIEGSGRPFYNN